MLHFTVKLIFYEKAVPPFKGNAIKLSEKKPIIENLQMDKKVGW
jgi:hypothetical protein